MKSMNHKYMHLGRLADAYNASNGLSPRNRKSAMFVARQAAGVAGDVKSATHGQMDEMISYLEGRPECGDVREASDGRADNPGRAASSTPKARKKQSRESRRNWFNKRYGSDQVFAIRHSMRRTVATALKRAGFIKKQSSLKIVGCTPSELKRHIELQFLPGMSWLNRSEWHVDHIVPLSSAASEEELLALCHFTNLRPIWAKENLKKSSHRTHLI
jgi:hypothetical protein